MISLFLAIFCLVGWIMGAMRPGRRTWVVLGAIAGVAILAFYVYAVCQHITPDLGFDRNIGVHWLPLFAMIGGVGALLSKPKAPADPAGVNHDGATHA